MSPRTEKTSGLHVLLLLMFVFTCDGKISSKELPGLDVCGRPYKLDLATRVINGSPAKLGAYPWMANIGYTTSPTGSGKVRWECGGSLITTRYVTTAAHCLHPSVIGIRTTFQHVTKVRLGELDLDPTKNDEATPIDFDIETITYHKGFRLWTKENDVGLVKLKGKVTYSDFIRPICLPPLEFQLNLFVGFSPTIAGWGKSVKDSIYDNNTLLLEAEVQIKDTEPCRANITSAPLHKNDVIDDRVVCASAPGKDACQGDSGGPLMLRRDIKRGGSPEFGNYFLMGITSYGYRCAEEGYPGVYARASKYLDWIMNNMDT